MNTWVVKAEEREYEFLFERNADRFAAQLRRGRIRAEVWKRFSPGDPSDEEYWMLQDGRDYRYESALPPAKTLWQRFLSVCRP